MRTALFAVAALALAACGPSSTGSTTPGRQGQVSISGDYVMIKVQIESDADAIAIFRAAANNKGCRTEESSEGSSRSIYLYCDEGELGAVQDGSTVTYGCPHKQRDAERCKQYALALIDTAGGATSGGGGNRSPLTTGHFGGGNNNNNNSGGGSGSGRTTEMQHTDDGTPYFTIDMSSLDAGTDLYNVAELWLTAAGCTDVSQNREDQYVQAFCQSMLVVAVPIDTSLNFGCANSTDAQCQGLYALLMDTLDNL